MNPCGKGCCAWHISATVFANRLRSCLARPCDQGVIPHCDWQCTSCLAMNESSEESDLEDDVIEDKWRHLLELQECNLCGKEQVPQAPSNHSQASSSYAARSLKGDRAESEA